MAQEDTNGTETRNANARGRLDALKARRAAGKGGPGLLAGAPGGRGKGAGGAAAGGKAGGRLRSLMTSPEGAQKRKAIMRLVQMLKTTPDDGSGAVEGTAFTKAGVQKLVEMLQKRASDTGAAGGKTAAAVLRRLTTPGKDAGEGGETVHGVQVSRLVQLAKLAEKQ